MLVILFNGAKHCLVAWPAARELTHAFTLQSIASSCTWECDSDAKMGITRNSKKSATDFARAHRSTNDDKQKKLNMMDNRKLNV